MTHALQADLFPPAPVYFDGATYDHDRDGDRLGSQMERVRSAMDDRVWRSLEAISEITGDPVTSISARLRDLRKARFGAHIVERRYVAHGLYEYRMAA